MIHINELEIHKFKALFSRGEKVVKIVKKEQGYALFLVMVIVILFGVLSTSLLALTATGAKRSMTREDVTKATEMSEKGIQHTVQHIQNELKTVIGESGIPKDEFASRLSIVLNKYRCGAGDHITPFESSGDTYEVCIEEITSIPGKELEKVVTFKSVGEVNGRTEEISSTISFGAQSVPDNLKYALGTVVEGPHMSNGAGNVYLHGGVEIIGDIKVDNHLFTFDYGPGMDGYGYAEWQRTTLPTLLPSPGNERSNIVLGGNLYTFNSHNFNSNVYRTETYGQNQLRKTSENYYDNHLKWNNMNRYQSTTLDRMFTNTDRLPIITDRETAMNDVSIEENIDNNKDFVTNLTLEGSHMSNINSNNSILFYPFKYSWILIPVNSELIFSNSVHFKEGKIERSGYELQFSSGNFSFDRLYVNRDVFIGNGSTSYNPNAYANISIDGFSPNRGALLLVNGNVTIQGANLTSNLMIYATGEVTIRNTTIQGKEFSPGREGSLIVFSKGKIQIANNSLYKNNPSELKGYFYSEQDLEMYGVGSNIKIHGGVSARRITLNAIRGNYEGEVDDWRKVINPISTSSPSRLTIEYDTELIENILELYPPEEYVKELRAPMLIERQ